MKAKKKPRFFNYLESTYGVEDFGKSGSERIDVTFLTQAKSKAEALRKMLEVPCIKRGGSVNWVRERLSEGASDKAVSMIVDDAVYCFEFRSSDYLGKYLHGEWIPKTSKGKQ